MIPTLIAVVALIFFGLIIGIINKKNNAKKEFQFKDLSTRYQLEYYKTKSLFKGTKFELRGTYKDLPIKFFEEIKGSGKNKIHYTVISLKCKDFGFKFKIGKENFITRLGKFIGFKDIEFQDHNLDRTFLFKSEEESKFRSLMNHDILNELQRVKNDFHGFIDYKSEHLLYKVQSELTDDLKKKNLENILPVMEKIINSRTFV